MPELHYCSQAASTEEIVVDWTEEGRCHNGRLSEQRLRNYEYAWTLGPSNA